MMNTEAELANARADAAALILTGLTDPDGLALAMNALDQDEHDAARLCPALALVAVDLIETLEDRSLGEPGEIDARRVLQLMIQGARQ